MADNFYKNTTQKQLLTPVLLSYLDFCLLRAALAETSKLYDSVDDALHRLVRVSNQRGRDLEALGRLARLVDKLEKVSEEGRRHVWFYSHFTKLSKLVHSSFLKCLQVTACFSPHI